MKSNYRSPIPSQDIGNRPKAFAHGGDHVRPGSNQNVEAAAKNPQVIDSPTYTFKTTAFKVGTTTQTIVGKNPRRRFLFIQNKEGGNTAQISFGALAVPEVDGGFNSVDFPAGTQWDFDDIVPNNEVRAVCLPETEIVVVEGIVDGE